MDDEEGPRASLKVVFKTDFDVLLAANGQDAIALAQGRHIDVAILDILMQGMSGVDVLRELKQLDEGIEVIMLTAYETLETARQALRLGAREYLNKPFDIPTLRSVTARALERRRANAELRVAHQRLVELQVELTRNAALGESATTVMHDLNSPLAVIGGFVELLNRQLQNVAALQGDELEMMRSSLGRVKDQVHRCLEISRRYLTSTRTVAPADERASIQQVLTDLKELLLKHPCAGGNQFDVELPAAPVFAAINDTDLLRVLLNLATNALQACTRPHRVIVFAQALTPSEVPTTFLNNDNERIIGENALTKWIPMVAISVRDQGEGMPPEVMRRLFVESFSTKPSGHGHGVGLGSVKNLVLSAKGAVRVSTAPGMGSSFTVYLPAKN